MLTQKVDTMVTSWVYPSVTLATSINQRNYYARIFRPVLVAYSHLSPSHLHTAVETVAAYGKPSSKTESISSGTVTETGTCDGQIEGNSTQAAESIGAGDGI